MESFQAHWWGFAAIEARIVMSDEVRVNNGEWRDEIAQEYPGYEVLVQLDEDDEISLRFYDCGTLFFLIKPEDLAARNFENVKCVLYSY